MKPFVLLALLAGVLVTASCGSDSSASANVVARVNGKDITTSQLEKQVQVRLNGAEQPPSPEEQQDLKLQVLNQMVNDQDAVFLLLFLRANQGPDATFMCANGLAEKFGWRRHRLSGARSRLIELGHMRSIRQAGRGHPALFRWAK